MAKKIDKKIVGYSVVDPSTENQTNTEDNNIIQLGEPLDRPENYWINL
jgi:hypothetical protein